MRISDWSSDVCSSDLHVVDVARHADGQAFHRIGQIDLAGEPRGSPHARREIEHVLPGFRRLWKLVEIQWINNDMASGTGHRALARPPQRLPGRLHQNKEPTVCRPLHLQQLTRKRTSMNTSHQCEYRMSPTVLKTK